MKILLIKPSGIGDIIHSLPVAICLKKINSGNRVDWLIFSKFASILNNIEDIDNVILWDRDGGLKEYFRIIKFIRKQDYDVVVDLQVLLRTSFLAFLSTAKQKIACSFPREFSYLFVRPIDKFDPNLHAVERNYQVLKMFTANNIKKPEEFLPWIKLTANEKQFASETLKDVEKPMLFSVGSRGLHKIWPQENYSQLIDLLHDKYRITPVFLGMVEEAKLVEEVIKRIKCQYKNLVGKTDLRTASAIINECILTIGNDNGIMHISAALNKPTLTIFGSTNPKWYYPYNKKSSYIYKGYSCSPCGVKTSCRDFKCMKDIKVEEVYNIIEEKFQKYLL